MESWLFDDTKPFIHLECLDTLQFLREQIKTGYFEDLIQKYLLDNAHGAVVVVAPEKGLNLAKEQALAEKLAVHTKVPSEIVRNLLPGTGIPHC